jgi:predicted RNA-binding Zn ribbon-like protein
VGSVSNKDFLPDAAALREFLVAHEMDAPPRITDADLEDVRRWRARIAQVWEAGDERSKAELLNKILLDVRALPQLTDHDGLWHLHYVSSEAPVGHKIAAAAAMGLANVLGECGKERFGMCAADDCRDVFVDTSRNKSRRYCDDTCSTRMNVAAYRKRKKEASSA